MYLWSSDIAAVCDVLPANCACFSLLRCESSNLRFRTTWRKRSEELHNLEFVTIEILSFKLDFIALVKFFWQKIYITNCCSTNRNAASVWSIVVLNLSNSGLRVENV